MRTHDRDALSRPYGTGFSDEWLSATFTTLDCALVQIFLEPISKSPEEDNEAGELNEAKEVLWMIFPSDEDPTLPLDPGEEAFDQTAPQEASQAAPVLRRRLRSVRAVRRDHLDAILT